MTHQFLIAFGLVTMLAVIACGSASVAPRTANPTQITTSTAAAPTDARASATELAATTTTPQRRDSWEQPLWTNPESESDTMLVTLVSSQGQLEEGESTVITASAINMSDAPLEVNLIIRLGAAVTLVARDAGAWVQGSSPLPACMRLWNQGLSGTVTNWCLTTNTQTLRVAKGRLAE